ncbi:LOW QUALITY PROTEIN: hypothetical protein PHPALM_30967 [Phytophthora palmivora]|uniref:Uncharacterized protein n=1 Tax=Phytophthora palmivora TaxID=4796 RepID=A0A2P4X3R8_9STRA|nr:LOW QUALITY PROTEIN: hypothetical protein PHPALM_30967 [Phytophthora palmivora]
MLHGEVLQSDLSVVQLHQAHRHVFGVCVEDVKLGLSPGWNPVRAERSRYCVYAYVEKRSESTVNKLISPIENACDLPAPAISSLRPIDEYSRSNVTMALEISKTERLLKSGVFPDKRFKQSTTTGKINSEKTTLLFDSDAEVSILDATFVRKVGCYIDESHTLECKRVEACFLR